MTTSPRAFICVGVPLALSCCVQGGPRQPGREVHSKATRSVDGPAPGPLSWLRPARGRPRSPVARSLLLRGASVWTGAGKVLPQTDILVVRGRIEAVGSKLEPPTGAIVVDATGKHVTPGLIDPHSHLGVFPLPALKGHSDGNEVGNPLTPSARAADALWSGDPAIPRALAAGVTTVHVVPGSANLVGGLSQVIKLRPGRSAAALAFPGALPGLKMACGENPKRTYGSRGGPFTRMGNVARVRAAFQRAFDYRRAWERYDALFRRWASKAKAGGADAGRSGSHATTGRGGAGAPPPAPPKRDPDLDVLAAAVAGQIQIHWHCYRADEMRLRLRLTRQLGVRIAAFHHATEAYKLAGELRRHRVAAVTWVRWWGFKAEAMDAIPEGPALLAARGALVTLHSDSPREIQHLHHEAGLAFFRGTQAGLGITRDQALAMVTRNPAEVLGIAAQTGTLEVGKMADLVVWSGDPFSVYTRAEQVYVDGELLYDQRSGLTASDFELGQVPTPDAKASEASIPSEVTTPPKASRPPEAVSAHRTSRQPDAPRSPTSPPLAPLAAPRGPITLAVIGGRVLTMAGGPAVPHTLLVAGDRVAALGPGLGVPAGVPVIDARGALVTPGLVAADSGLGLVDIDLEPSANESGPTKGVDPIRAALRCWDGLNLRGAAIPVTRAEGFTTALARPRGGLVAGQGAAFDLWGDTHLAAALVAPLALHANLGMGGASAQGGSRALAWMRLRQIFNDARLFARHGAAVESRRFRPLAAPLPDLRALGPVLAGKIPLVVSAHRASDIRAALSFAAEERIRVVIAGGAEAWQVAGALGRAGVSVLVDLEVNQPESYETLGARPDNAARLNRAGVTVGFSTAGAAHDTRALRFAVGRAVAWGLPHAAAMEGLTSVPARLFGLADRGVLRPGALANLVVWTGDPLELSTRVRHLVIHGRQIPLTNRQTLLLGRYRSPKGSAH